MMPDLQTAAWFLAQLKRNSGAVAERNLRQQGYRTFLPIEEVTQRRNGRFATRLRPLFPGYIFVAFDAADGHWRAINSTYGVKRLVSFGLEPAAVPTEVIAELMARCDENGRILPPKVMKSGDRVSLTSGPFAEFVATVEKIAPDRRVWVLMELMGAVTRVAVPPDGLRHV